MTLYKRYSNAVSGDANFSMDHTGLTVGGFTQPSVASTFIEVQGNSEKGLCQRFLWIFPQPYFAKFNELQLVDQNFSTSMGKGYCYTTGWGLTRDGLICVYGWPKKIGGN